MQKFPMFLAGCCSTPNQSLVVTDKFTKQAIATAPLANAEHIEQAIRAGVKAAKPMRDLSGSQRKRILLHCVGRLRQLRDDLVQTLIQEAGKPISASELEVDRCIDTFTIAAEESVRWNGSVIALDGTPRGEGLTGFVKPFPVGLCSLITPFNFPLNLVAHKVAPAIAAGCPFILKPASWTPLCALMLGDILQEAGLPEGAFSILPCNRDSSGPLVTDDRIAMLSFTGSDQVGWKMKKDCGRKRICLELGGNAMCILDRGMDWKPILPKLAQAAFAQSGQSCISLQRLLIGRDEYDAVVGALAELVSTLPAGDPGQRETVVGPMIDDAEADRILQWIEEAKSHGAIERLVAKRIPNTSIVTPAILERVPHDQSLCRDEAFGPVLIVEAYDRFEDALERVNASRYGLQTGIFTDSMQHAHLAWETLEVGGVIINDTPSTRLDSMPYGGVKDSGFGREGVRYAMAEMMHERLLVYRR